MSVKTHVSLAEVRVGVDDYLNIVDLPRDLACVKNILHGENVLKNIFYWENLI